jgi:hypothetical protein
MAGSGPEVRVIVHMHPDIRDKIKEIGRREGRVLMRQVEDVMKRYVADYEKKNGAVT